MSNSFYYYILYLYLLNRSYNNLCYFINNFVTLVIIYVTTNNTSYTLFIQDMIDKDMTNYNKQDMLYIVTESVT